MIVMRGDAQLEVLADGKGPSIVLLPSLGRGAHDFDPIAERLAARAFACCGRSRAASAKAPGRGPASRWKTSPPTSPR